MKDIFFSSQFNGRPIPFLQVGWCRADDAIVMVYLLVYVSGRREWPRCPARASSEMRRSYSECEGDKAGVDQ